MLFAAYSLLDDKKMTTSEISRFYCYYYETKQKYLLLTFPRLSVGLAVLLLLVSRPPAGEAEVEAAALGGPRARARAVAPHQPGGGARGRGGARAAAGDCQLSAEVRIEVTGYVCLSLFTKYHHLHCDHGLDVCSLTSTWRGVCRPGSGSRGGAGPGSPASPRPGGRTAAARSTEPAPGQYLDIYTAYRYISRYLAPGPHLASI